jgi:DNA-binding GntR family transcriptional regulator
MSAIPIREALHQLEGEGIVVLSPNRSAMVRMVDEPLLRNIFEVRLLLEGAFTRWFVTHHTPADLALLVATQERYDIAVREDDVERCQELNRAFHSICYDRHYNGEALAIYSKYTNLLRALFRRFPNSPVRARSAGREHWQIIDAIRTHDEARAVQTVEDHTRATCQYMIECIYSEKKVRSPLHAAE